MSTLILKVDRPAYGGLYIGTHEGKIVMISGAVLPGETVEVTVEVEKKDYIRAAARKILEPSPFRIEPACKYFGTCGGCQLQHIPFKMQIKLKEDILRDCLKRQAKTETALSGPVIYGNPWNYRLRGQFKVFHGAIGFYKENTREVVDIDNCPLMTKDINEYLQKIRAIIKNIDVEEVHITAGEEASVAFIKSTAHIKSLSDTKVLASIFLDLGFSGLFIGTKDKKIYRFGKEYITLMLPGNQKYTVSPITFLQSHWRLNRTVVEFIKNRLQPLKGKRLLDIYSGAGNFSIPLAIDADVTAVEENPYAVRDGIRNLEINNIRNCRFINSSAEDFNTKDNFDIIIIDPPRGGITNKLMERILSIKPEEIVYISCNPSTLARDLKKLLQRYNLESVRLIDFFPQTFHIESLAYLRRQ
jgi:23S rRNA (uracil1939-C5)-methyltransferase